MNNRESITSWIQGLPEVATSRSQIRKLIYKVERVPSPPASLETGDEDYLAWTAKRRCLEGSDDGLDLDARRRVFADNIPSLSDLSSITRESRRSGTSSPTKKLALPQLAGELETKPLNIHHFPKVAGSDDLLESIEEIGRGLNILPYRMKSTIEKKVTDLGESAEQWRTTFQSPEIVDDLPGCIPSFEDVDGVVKWADRCQQDECEEAAWNCDVHLPLLRKVFGDAEQKINAMLWYVLLFPFPSSKHRNYLYLDAYLSY